MKRYGEPTVATDLKGAWLGSGWLRESLVLLWVTGVQVGLALGAYAAEKAVLPADHAEKMSRGLRTFDATIQAALKEHCLRCHGGEKTRGELNLVTREGLLQGGAHGPVVVPFQPGQSRLLRLVRHTEEPHMPDPHSGQALPAALVDTLEAWIADGAPYSAPLIAGAAPPATGSPITEADRQWWAFQPLRTIEPPLAVPGQNVENPIDRFLLQQARRTLPSAQMAPRADAVTLLRRASLDLLGLPPSLDEVNRFSARFSQEAWVSEIRRLLSSPHHGERWARHWLDVARFAESSGFEHDYDREGAFHYRDFVIRALNKDLPYDTFVRWQIAGDELAPEDPLAMAATGFLGAGVFPTQITANEVERTRYDALDDMLSTTGSAFLGLSFGCARCHDHKYDPIPSHDYYRMLATFTTTVRSVVELDMEPERTRRDLEKWVGEEEALRTESAKLRQHLSRDFDAWFQGDASAPPQLSTSWTLLSLTNLSSKAGAEFREQADHSHLVTGSNGDRDEYTLTGFTMLNRVRALRLEALPDATMKRGGPGRADNGNFGLSRIRVFVGSDLKAGELGKELVLVKPKADFEQNQQNLSIASSLDDKDNTGWAIDPEFGKPHAAVFELADPLSLPSGGVVTVQLRFHVNGRHNMGRFRISLLQEGAPELVGEPVSKEVMHAYERRGQAGKGTGAALSEAQRSELFLWWLQQNAEWKKLQDRTAQHSAGKPRNTTKVLICGEGYPALRMHTQGADFFKETYHLRRGNTDLKNGVAEPGFLQVLNRRSPGGDTTPWKVEIPEKSRYSGRRTAFARWITDVEHGGGALLARVMVNRLWQHHFGRGIVSTPNDFGRTGSLPTHPELLDWLAMQLIQSGWRLKPMHELILSSAAYQQSVSVAEGAGKDRISEEAMRGLFLRQTPRRLEGEALRDTLLAVSGELDPTLFGPGTHDPLSKRRSIYFTVKRSQLIQSMVAFDQPEPLVSQGVRPVTTVPPQALYIMNSKAMRNAAESMARRLWEEAGTGLERQGSWTQEKWKPLVTRAYERSLSRRPRADEMELAIAFLEVQKRQHAGGSAETDQARQMALADYLQALFGLNEMVYQP